MSHVIAASGREIEISNPDKVLFPKAGITKADLADYYNRIAGIALAHYRRRPLTMHRFPNGIDGKQFFQKDAPDYFPDWIDRATLKKEGGSVSHVVANSAATLVYLADQGCITPHVGQSRVDEVDRPDRLIFDLDPADDDFPTVQMAARWLRELCEELDLTSFVQTTGSRGLHVVIPLDRSADFDAALDFARRLATCLAERHPDDLTVEQRKESRKGRLFLDYLRNAYGQTAVAPYAVRAREGAPIATPLDWVEVSAKDLTADAYTLGNIFRRLSQKADPWAEIDRHGHAVSEAAGRLRALIGAD